MKKVAICLLACLGLAACLSFGASSVSADEGNEPAPAYCTHPYCWQA